MIFLVDEVLAVFLCVWSVRAGIVALAAGYAGVVAITVDMVIANVSSQVVGT